MKYSHIGIGLVKHDLEIIPNEQKYGEYKCSRQNMLKECANCASYGTCKQTLGMYSKL